MAKTIQEFLDRPTHFGETRLTVDDLPHWQQEDIKKALRHEEPSGNLKHISRSLAGCRKVACGATLLVHRSRDIVDPWTFEMLHQEGRDDLCRSCMGVQRRAWANINRPTYCAELAA